MTVDQSLSSLTATEDSIAAYLRQHPDFFVDKPSLLADLELPHHAGGAISLVERQVGVLRDRNKDMRYRLTALLSNARNNDQLFEKTKRLILSLLEAQDVDDLIDALMYSFTNDFAIHHTVLMLFSEEVEEDVIVTNDNIRIVPYTAAQQTLGTIISNNQTVCGQLDTVEQEFIFQEQALSIGSTAIAPLSSAKPLGVLAIGNPDPDYYRSSMNTLFLTYIGEVFSRLLPRYLPH